jgi:hypothetical protein
MAEAWERCDPPAVAAEDGYHLYYRYEASSEHVLVVAVWGAKRGSEPTL